MVNGDVLCVIVELIVFFYKQGTLAGDILFATSSS